MRRSTCSYICAALSTLITACGSSGGKSGVAAGSAAGAGASSVGGAMSASSSGASAPGGAPNSVAGGASGVGGTAGNVATSSGGTTGSAHDGGMPVVGPVPDVAFVKGTCSPSASNIALETAEFCVQLAKSSQTIAALAPKAAPGFDFTPVDQLATRSAAGYFQLGDITLRLRSGSTGDWQNVTTATSRTQVTTQTPSGSVLASADLAPALPAGLPLDVTRTWSMEGGRLVMRFVLANHSSSPVQIGALGLPMVFNNVLTNRTLEQAHDTCSFADPYIGADAGYLQVTRLNGQGPVLLVLPDGKTPFEAYNPILNVPKAGSKDPVAIFTDPTPRGTSFEGFLEWMVHSKAYADKEWANASPWNPPTDLTLAPGDSKTYGLQFVLAPEVRKIESVLATNHRPVAVGIPGYVLPTDVEGKLFLEYPWAVSSIAVEPSTALTVTPQGSTATGYAAYAVSGKAHGRARVSVTYADGTVQTIQYDVVPPAKDAVSSLGTFLTNKAWFVDANDPFGRSPSVMTYDHDLGQSVTQTKQAWVCGLGDDGGATWLAGAMKLFGQPDAAQAAKYEQFVDGVVWGNLQYDSGAQKYGVKRSLFYYEPTLLPAGYYSQSVQWIDPTTNMTYWGAWSKAHTLEVPRSYNYPHVAALYWALYRVARNTTGTVTHHPWDWYLNQAYETAVAMTTIGTDYTKYGLMDGTVFLEILDDLKREGLTQNASDLETRMKAREAVWRTEAYPFGSEMPWDSTGQEEVYAWTRYFKDTAKSKTCIDAITSYMPAIPHWAYNGCARRYWDFVYGGAKIDRIERMVHHYGSSLNAIPILTEFRDHPDDLHLLRIGYAGMMGSLAAIADDGFPSMAFHSFPDTLKWDAITGDYGLNFFGHAESSGTYLVNDSDFGWQAFGGNVAVNGSVVNVTPLDSFRRRVYLAPVGLYLTLDAGEFASVDLDAVTHDVHVHLAPTNAYTASARLRIEQPAQVSGVGTYGVPGTTERGAVVVPLTAATTDLALTAK
ncbi:MAG TPA: DUF5695 domain-containing protein [Polyangiaceae bacterium]|jgi:hypothetical protein|nr:DUF5695 domain-containing protein [Polyangiaceae bacterium]